MAVRDGVNVFVGFCTVFVIEGVAVTVTVPVHKHVAVFDAVGLTVAVLLGVGVIVQVRVLVAVNVEDGTGMPVKVISST